MAIKIYKKNTAGRRNMSIVKADAVSGKKPEKSLVCGQKRRAGRSGGKISVRHQGGGHKQRYRLVDFHQDRYGIPARIEAIEKDPNRSSFIALVVYKDGRKDYVLATDGMKAGQSVLCAPDAPVKNGNRLKVRNIPSGTTICNIELFPGHGGQIVRSAGSGAILTAVEEKNSQIKMPSGEIRMVSSDCFATVGQISNFEHGSVSIGKAGRSRWMNKRPTVRGTVMNPVDHPHGGGEGCQGIGLKHPKTPWGKPALGKKTRKKKRYSDKFIVKRRSKRK